MSLQKYEKDEYPNFLTKEEIRRAKVAYAQNFIDSDYLKLSLCCERNKIYIKHPSIYALIVARCLTVSEAVIFQTFYEAGKYDSVMEAFFAYKSLPELEENIRKIDLAVSKLRWHKL